MPFVNDSELAKNIRDKKVFLEIIMAPSYDEKALEILAKKANCRVMEVDMTTPFKDKKQALTVNGGLLYQDLDNDIWNEEDLKVVTKKQPTKEEYEDLLFAMKCCKHVKSNAIVAVKDGHTVGVGAGQMNRVGSAEIALRQAEAAGFADLKDGADYDALYSSALCRAKADWIIGINATRLFSCLYHKTLNVGRVQTPTLKMLVDREAQIMSFKKEKYHIVLLDLEGTEAASARISDREKADKLKDACRASSAVCVSVSREKKTVTPPKLFDLTTLQREANKLYGYTAKQTLDLAQALYEKRLLTYPRTDSIYLTEDMSETAASVAALLSVKLPFMKGADFAPDLSRVLDSKKVSDHHAIIPTMELEKTELSALPETERNILSLVGARLLFAAAAPHTYEAVKAIFRCADTEFTATGKTVLCGGWKELERRYRATLKQKPDDEDGDGDDLSFEDGDGDEEF